MDYADPVWLKQSQFKSEFWARLAPTFKYKSTSYIVHHIDSTMIKRILQHTVKSLI